MSMPHREVCPIRHCQGHASAFSYGVKSKKDGHVSNSGKDGQFTAMEGFEIEELASVVYPALCMAVKTTVRSSLSSTPSTMSFASSSCASVVAVLNCLYLEKSELRRSACGRTDTLLATAIAFETGTSLLVNSFKNAFRLSLL